MLEKYINKLRIEDINNYALKNNIKLDNNELNLIYDVIKKRWKEIYINGIKIINEYKDKLKENTYNKLIELYNNIKRY